MSFIEAFKNKQNTQTQDDTKQQKPHADGKLALLAKMSEHKETKAPSNLVSVDASADSSERLRSDSQFVCEKRNIHLILILIFLVFMTFFMIHLEEPLQTFANCSFGMP